MSVPSMMFADGEWDVATVEVWRERLFAAIDADESGSITLDLSQVTFMDSSGLGLLDGAATRCRTRGGELTLRAPSEQILRTMKIVGLDSSVRVEADPVTD